LFRRDAWLNGNTPALIAPDLFKLSFSKKLTVRVALNIGAWMPELQRMSNERELDKFIEL
jgi:hypothetical protein